MAIIATTLDLFRAGTKNGGPRFERFPPSNPGVAVESRNGVDWVLGPNQGGASTKEAPGGVSGIWFKLPAGTKYDDTVFHVWNDYDDHHVWEPAQDMQLADYLAALASLNSEFIRV